VSVRRLYLDHGPGEARGVVTLDGRPERLLIRRIDDSPRQRVGARLVARVRRVDRGLATAFIDLGEAPDAVLALTGAVGALVEGAAIEVEITAAPRRHKGAIARLIGPADGAPRLISDASGLADQLAALAARRHGRRPTSPRRPRSLSNIHCPAVV
jgi:hypothetical protein